MLKEGGDSYHKIFEVYFDRLPVGTVLAAQFLVKITVTSHRCLYTLCEHLHVSIPKQWVSEYLTLFMHEF